MALLLIGFLTYVNFEYVQKSLSNTEPSSPIQETTHFSSIISEYLNSTPDSRLISLIISHPNLFIFLGLVVCSSLFTFFRQQSSLDKNSPDKGLIQNASSSVTSSPQSYIGSPECSVLPSLFVPSVLEWLIDNGNFCKSFRVKSFVNKECGFVYLAQHKLDGFFYTVKAEVFEGGLGEEKIEFSILDRVKRYKSLKCSGIARYVTCWIEEQPGQVILYVQMEKIEGEDLEKYSKNGISAQDFLRILRKTAKVLKFLHSKGLSHGNISMNNIFVDDFSKVLIGEFDINQNKLSDLQGFLTVHDELLQKVIPADKTKAQSLIRCDKFIKELVIYG